MAGKSQRALGKKPTKMFMGYAVRLVFRLCVFAVVVYYFITHPERLKFTTYFGPAHGFNLIDFIFIALLADIATKFFPQANISMGSLKQYRHFHVPTAAMFEGGREGLIAYAKDVLSRGQDALRRTTDTAREIVAEVKAELASKGRFNIRNIEFLRLLPFTDRQLSTTKAVRRALTKARVKEIIPALIFWVVFNLVIGFALAHFHVLNEGTILLWTCFFYVFDMVCVVLWCPIQLIFMKNRCCTTCQIFNWDALMTVTPLLTTFSVFSIILIALAVIVIIRWEVTAIRFPERFDERTNASLSCANCRDKLCYLRQPLNLKFDEDVEVTPASAEDEAVA